jgi:hypothetical protein
MIDLSMFNINFNNSPNRECGKWLIKPTLIFKTYKKITKSLTIKTSRLKNSVLTAENHLEICHNSTALFRLIINLDMTMKLFCNRPSGKTFIPTIRLKRDLATLLMGYRTKQLPTDNYRPCWFYRKIVKLETSSRDHKFSVWNCDSSNLYQSKAHNRMTSSPTASCYPATVYCFTNLT